MDVANPRDNDVATIGARLQAATVAHRDAQETARVHAARWRDLVIEAVDSGLRIRDVAQLARVSAARVHAILARAE